MMRLVTLSERRGGDCVCVNGRGVCLPSVERPWFGSIMAVVLTSTVNVLGVSSQIKGASPALMLLYPLKAQLIPSHQSHFACSVKDSTFRWINLQQTVEHLPGPSNVGPHSERGELWCDSDCFWSPRFLHSLSLCRWMPRRSCVYCCVCALRDAAQTHTFAKVMRCMATGASPTGEWHPDLHLGGGGAVP